MINFACLKYYSDSEIKTLMIYSILEKNIKLNYFFKSDQVPLDHIAIGHIDWVISVLKFIPKPNYYPNFLKSLLFRKVWKTNKWPMKKGVFVKPSDKPKRFLPIITIGNYKGKKKPPYWCSDIVSFINEWRYYVVNGEIIFAAWYQGENEIKPPKFPVNITIPKKWCGCIDLGRLRDGRLALVEAGEPYSIGFYSPIGVGGKIYADFLKEGWKYLRNREFENPLYWIENLEE